MIVLTRARWMAVGVSLLIAALIYGLTASGPGPRTLRQFDPDRAADLELGMWQAYYAKQRVRLFALLVTMLHEQNHYSWATAAREAFYLARAAATFGDARANYDVVLPDLTIAYGIAKRWLHAGFDPAAVASAELAWWVARRTPGEDSPEHVGDLMATAYAWLYEVPRSQVKNAAILRAQAAALRDAQAAQPDWGEVGRLLRESYHDLHQALGSAPSPAAFARATASGLQKTPRRSSFLGGRPLRRVAGWLLPASIDGCSRWLHSRDLQLLRSLVRGLRLYLPVPSVAAWMLAAAAPAAMLRPWRRKSVALGRGQRAPAPGDIPIIVEQNPR